MLLAFVRAFRGAVWGGAVASTIVMLVLFEQSFPRQGGAPQQCAVAGEALVHLLVAYVLARALDRMLMLAAEGLGQRGGG